MDTLQDVLQQLSKALEAGGYNAAPGKLEDYVVVSLEDLDFSFKLKSCECGAAKLGYKSFSPGHSNWCPVKLIP